MQKIIVFILIISCSSLYAAKDKSAFTVRGVTGDAATNVELRLSEMQQLKPLTALTTDELSAQAIKALEPYGYFNATAQVQIFNGQTAQVTINPGPVTYISALSISIVGAGAEHPALQIALAKLKLHKGEPLLTARYNKAKQKLTTTAENLGFLHATFKQAEILIDEQTHTAQITLVLDTGPQFYFGQVQFNPTTINPELLHRYVPFHQGQPYSTDKVLQLNNDLAKSSYFSSVLVKPQISDAQSVPINVLLQPVPKYSYTLGAGFGTDTGIRGRAGLNIIPVNRRGHKFMALAQGSMNQNALQAQYVIPGKKPVADQFTVTGNVSNLNYDAGYANAYLFSLAQQHNVDYYKRTLSLNALYERFNYTFQPRNDQFMIYPKATFSFNNTDNKLFAPTGYKLSVNALGASKAALSKTNFAQASLDAKGAYMIEPLRLRLYGHTIQGITAIDDINELPLSLALLLGGTDNLKGFGFNSIGPGRRVSFAGVELQKEIVNNWYLVGFYDVGDVFDPALRATQYDVGAALMWVSPIGPIKAGLAQPVTNRFQRDSSSPRFILSMGPDI